MIFTDVALLRRPHVLMPLAGIVGFLAVAMVVPSIALAQTGPELFLAPFPKELRLDVTAGAAFQDAGHAKGADDDFRLEAYETEGRLRINPGDVASPRLGYNLTFLNIDSTIPGMPDRLIDQSVGFATPITEYEEWVVGVSLAVGYAGDSFFGDGDAFYGKAAIGAFKQLSETDSIILAIDYNGNRTYKPDIPLPGIAYVKRIESRLLVTVGLPVTSIEWEPIDRLRVEFSYLLVDEVRARVGYEVIKNFEVFGAAGQRSEAFFLDGLSGNKDRLLFQQRHAEAGITYRARAADVGDPDFELTAAVGYAFNGEFSTGHDQTDSDLLADVSDEPYVRFGLRARF